jgi:hypothetical protein
VAFVEDVFGYREQNFGLVINLNGGEKVVEVQGFFLLIGRATLVIFRTLTDREFIAS